MPFAENLPSSTGMVECRSGQINEIFKQMDSQLVKFGLELVMYDYPGNTYIWDIEKRHEES